MSNLSEMLSKPLETLDDPVIPTGTWKSKIKGGKVGDVRTSEASGDEYRKVSVALALVEPGHDVDPTEVADGKYIGETVFFESYIKTERDMRQLLRTLQALGADVQLGGDPFEATKTAIGSLKGAIVNAEVSQEMYQNKPQTRVKKIFATA